MKSRPLAAFLSPLFALFPAWAADPPPSLTEFSGGGPEWQSVDDGVMGGLSQGRFTISGGTLRFSGTLSLENNGGFSSIRTRDGAFDLGGYSGVLLRVRGDGRTYSFRMNTDAEVERWGRSFPVAFSGPFATVKDEWTEVKVPFAALRQSFRGEELSGHPFAPGKISVFGVLLADYDPGEFAIEIDWIRPYREE